MGVVWLVVGLFVLASPSLTESEHDVTLTDREKRTLATLELTDLPDNLKTAVRRSANVKEHWCCKIRPTKVVINSRAVQQYIQRATKNTHYGKCGTFGWNRCSHNSVTYYRASTYRTVYSKQTVVTTCPDRDVVCCKGFLEIAKNCLPLAELAGIQKDLAILKSKGLLVG